MTPDDAQLSMDEWARRIDNWAEALGWNQDIDQRTQGDWAALAHSEISEALEAYRKHGHTEVVYEQREDGPDKPDGVVIEYADTLIRILHWFAQHGYSPSQAVAQKMRYNGTRSYRHGDVGRV